MKKTSKKRVTPNLLLFTCFLKTDVKRHKPTPPLTRRHEMNCVKIMIKKQVDPSKTRNIYRVIGTLGIPLLHSAPEVRNVYRKRITIKKQAPEGRINFLNKAF